MSYNLYAIICNYDVAKEFFENIKGYQWESLKVNDLILIPNTYTLINKHSQNTPKAIVEGFMTLDLTLHYLLEEVSKKGKIAYVEADYFGGMGEQSSKVFENGKCIHSKEWGYVSAINQALKILGVESAEGKDEFDTVGLGKHRSTEEWGKD